jgi:hypothetical protein
MAMTKEEKLIKKREWQEKYRKSAKGKITERKATAKRRDALEVDTDKFFKNWMTRVNTSAKSRNIVCMLKQEDLRQKIAEVNWKCAISKLPLTMKHNDRFKASVDRIDSSKGYTLDNIQIVATCVNMAKNAGTTEELINLCKAIAKANK